MKRTVSGFTIVELLIVIVVIAILAAISIVAYNGIQNRAHDSAVQSELANAVKKIKAICILNGGNCPAPLEADMGIAASKESYKTDRNNFYYCVDAAREQFAFGAESASGQPYTYSSTDGLLAEPVGVSAKITCKAAGATYGDSGVYVVGGYSGSTGAWAGWVN